MVSSGTKTTPPPSPVSAPRKPAISEPDHNRKVNSRTFNYIVSHNPDLTGAAAGCVETYELLLSVDKPSESEYMTHEALVEKAVAWLRAYGCGVVLSEQSCTSGETPDAIGWKRACHSVVVECKVSRADFLVDREKPFRRKPEMAMGCERFYLAPAEMISAGELPR